MIRESIKNEIYENLNYDIFRFEEFVITETYDDEEDTFNIKIIKDDYLCSFSFDGSDKVMVSFRPGKIYDLESDSTSLKNLVSYAYSNMIDWLERVKEEIFSPIYNRYIDESIKNFVDEINNKLEGMEDTYFTKSEAEDLKSRLDKLENIIIERPVNEENVDLVQEINKMKQEIEFLKSTIYNMSKKKWLKNTLLKFMAWSKDPANQEIIRYGIEGVRVVSQLELPKFGE